MDINTYAARNQVAHERILAAALLLAGAVTIPEETMDILKRIKAQDQDVHSLYQREAIAGVLEATAGHLGLYPLVEETPAAGDGETVTETTAAEDEIKAETGEETPPLRQAQGKQRKGGR